MVNENDSCSESGNLTGDWVTIILFISSLLGIQK